ncbi:MAG: hypothetical protein SFZ02_17450 [bacterium]|nr:hypothetical protein [bacterium]
MKKLTSTEIVNSAQQSFNNDLYILESSIDKILNNNPNDSIIIAVINAFAMRLLQETVKYEFYQEGKQIESLINKLVMHMSKINSESLSRRNIKSYTMQIGRPETKKTISTLSKSSAPKDTPKQPLSSSLTPYLMRVGNSKTKEIIESIAQASG